MIFIFAVFLISMEVSYFDVKADCKKSEAIRFAWLFLHCWVSQNQFFISGLSGDDIIQNRVLEALYQRIMRAFNEKKCFRVIIVIPLLPGFQVLILCSLLEI